MWFGRVFIFKTPRNDFIQLLYVHPAKKAFRFFPPGHSVTPSLSASVFHPGLSIQNEQQHNEQQWLKFKKINVGFFFFEILQILCSGSCRKLYSIMNITFISCWIPQGQVLRIGEFCCSVVWAVAWKLSWVTAGFPGENRMLFPVRLCLLQGKLQKGIASPVCLAYFWWLRCKTR